MLKKILFGGAFLLLIGAGCTSVQEQKVTTAPAAAPAAPCDVGTLCMQESHGEGGLLGVATVQAHYVGVRSYPDPMNAADPGTSCPTMAIDSANDPRVMDELVKGESGLPEFSISPEEAQMYEGVGSTTPKDASPVLIYIGERLGRDTGPCAKRVHILNY